MQSCSVYTTRLLLIECSLFIESTGTTHKAFPYKLLQTTCIRS